jgi:glucuronokinase
MAKECLQAHQPEKLAKIMNENFDKRKEIFPITRLNLEMINLARSVGASAKFSGSGGAIVGTYEDVKMFKNLKAALAEIGAEVIKPQVY